MKQVFVKESTIFERLFWFVWFKVFRKERINASSESYGYRDEYTEADVITETRTKHTRSVSREMWSEYDIYLGGLDFYLVKE